MRRERSRLGIGRARFGDGLARLLRRKGPRSLPDDGSDERRARFSGANPRNRAWAQRSVNLVGMRSRLSCAAFGALLGLSACGSGAPDADAEAPSTAVDVLDLRCGAGAPETVGLRRVTGFEYGNLLKDVLGLEVDVSATFPPDEESYGFDNQADTITVTDLHVDGYLRVAEQVMAWFEAEPARLDALAGCEWGPASCAEAFVDELGRRLLRRPLREAERRDLLGFFQQDGANAREAAGRVVAALLVSPECLYRVERAAGEGGLASPWVLASRLAFLLWGSAPDDELLDAAANGRLASPADVLKAAERLVEDPRARRGAAHFYLYWLDLAHFDDVEKDRRLFPRWSEEVRTELREETLHFVENVVWNEGARLETLLSASFTYATPLVADFYGVAPGSTAATAFVKTQLPAEQGRRGLLGHASLLSQFSTATQTSPIHRGKFVREQFFCTIPPPPPPELVVFPPPLDPANRRTTRERFAQHRSDSACSGCHEMLDPVGFGFEHFDASGRYREREGDNAIDDSGYLVGTDVDGPFQGLAGLSEKLLASTQVKRCVATQWFRYAFARGETADDSCTLDRLTQVLTESKGDLKLLMVALTQTTPFLAPSPAPAAEESP